jgi:hypothetical protein
MNPATFLKNQSPAFVAAFYIFGLLVSLVSLLVAMDARDHGNRKEVCAIWFFAVSFFPPVAFLYLFLKSRAAAGAAKREPEPTERIQTCPYCNGGFPPGTKICPHCGRLL